MDIKQKINDLQREAFNAISQGKIDLAIATLQEVLAIDPCCELAWESLYICYLENKNDIQSAYHVLETVYSLKPTDFKVLFRLGDFYLRIKNDSQKANEYYDSLLKYYPNDARTYHYIGGSLLSTDHPRAMAMLHHAIELDESYILPYINLSFQYEKAGDYQKAYSLLKEGYLKGDRSETPGRGSWYAIKYHLERIEKIVKKQKV